MPATISRAAYADMYGPTTGDKVRLADTELFIEVEEDRTTYGEEVKFGGGKVIRDGMGQSQATRADGAVGSDPEGRGCPTTMRSPDSATASPQAPIGEFGS